MNTEAVLCRNHVEWAVACGLWVAMTGVSLAAYNYEHDKAKEAERERRLAAEQRDACLDSIVVVGSIGGEQ